MAQVDDLSLITRSAPSRAAGRKASKLTAEQLDSSSDRDSTFGEPTMGKAKVKVTYGGRGRKNSPKKAPHNPSRSPVTPTRARGQSASAVRGWPALSARTRLDIPSQRSGTRSTLTPLTDSELELGFQTKGNRADTAAEQVTAVSAHASAGPSKKSGQRRRVTMAESNGGASTRTRAAPNTQAPRSRSLSVASSDSSLSSVDSSLFIQGEKKSPKKNARARTVQKKKSAANLVDGEKRAPRAKRASIVTRTPDAPPTSNRDVAVIPDLPIHPHTRKRPRSPPNRSSSPASSSLLTSLSSPPPTDLSSRDSKTKPVSLLHHASVISVDSSGVSPKGPELSLQRQSLLSASPSKKKDHTTDDFELWTLSDLGPHVWVRLDVKGEVVEEENDIDTLWWPAKVTHAKIPLRLSLFGDSLTSPDDVRVVSPSPYNVLSMSFGGAVRFNETNFRQSARAGRPKASPRKKQKTDLERRWLTARELMLKADEEENDGLPMMLSSYIGNGASSSAMGHAAAPSAPSDVSDVESIQRSWRAPSCDPTYTLPGELVLAKERNIHNHYWPAQLLEYIKPTKQGQKPKYKVRFYDGLVKNLDPSQFYTEGDDGFATCRLGEDRFNYGMDEGKDLSDAGVDDFNMDIDDDVDLHAPSPPPMLPVPEDFQYKLPLEEQFAYIKPVLVAVMKGEYEPANDRHDGFMRGAAARQKVCDTDHDRGSLLQREVEELDKLVRGWVRRRDRRDALWVSMHGGEPFGAAISPGDGGVRPEDEDMHVDQSDEHVMIGCDGPPSTTMDTESMAPPGGPLSAFVAPEIGAEVSEGHAGNKYDSVATDSHGPAHSPSVVDLMPDVEMKGAPSTTIGVDKFSNDVERARPTTTFRDLSSIEKITYCTNVLLHEAVLQLLLWRSGKRTISDLLPGGEEKRLHEIAIGKSQETDWVQDIVRMKQAISGNMLIFKGRDKEPSVSTSQGHTRSRPRRG